jgi:hypothetical protein
LFSLSYSTPCEIQGTIELKEYPSRLGVYTDIHGERWDIYGIFGRDYGDYVQACPQNNMHPYYNDTSGQEYGLVQQQWKPYRIKVVN